MLTWLTAFLDTEQEFAAQTEAFWSAVTGFSVSAHRGTRDEFASLLPPEGDPHLKLQVAASRPASSTHLDLHTDDVVAEASRAERLGAATNPHDGGYVVCRSPGGLTFCLVDHPASRTAGPTRWPGGRSMVDQVCLDIPPRMWDAECAFWAVLTGWDLVDRDPDDEFRRLTKPDLLALHVLLQRIDDEAPFVTAHLDLGTDDHLAETERHLGLGAVEVRRTPHWVTLADPSGRHYCVTTHAVDWPPQ